MDNRPQQPQFNNDSASDGNFVAPNQSDGSSPQQLNYNQPPQEPQNLNPQNDDPQAYPDPQNTQNPQDPQTFPMPEQSVQPADPTQQLAQNYQAPAQPLNNNQTENPQPQPPNEGQIDPQQNYQPGVQPEPLVQPQQDAQQTTSPQAATDASTYQASDQNQQTQVYGQQPRPAYDTIETTPHPQLHPAGEPVQPSPTTNNLETEPEQPAQQHMPAQDANGQNWNQPQQPEQESTSSQNENNQDFAQAGASSFPQLESHLPPIGPSAQPETSQDAPSQSPEQLMPSAPSPDSQAVAKPDQAPSHAPLQSPSQTQPSNTESQATANNAQAFALPGATESPNTPNAPVQTAGDDEAKYKESIATKLKQKLGNINYKPIMSAAIVGMLVFGVFNSQVILGQVQYLTTPSGGVDISSMGDAEAPVGDESRIFIPQIDVDVPIIDEPSFDEDLVQAALEDGVVHYGNTAQPGEIGNSVIVGHSSNDWWDAGDYKYAFILLDRLQDGNEIVIHHEGTRYVYEVTDSYVVEPTDLSVLEQPDDKSMVTLITCTPPGTSWQRLIVEAEQVSPDPAENTERGEDADQEAVEELPRDSGSRWFNIF